MPWFKCVAVKAVASTSIFCLYPPPIWIKDVTLAVWLRKTAVPQKPRFCQIKPKIPRNPDDTKKTQIYWKNPKYQSLGPASTLSSCAYFCLEVWRVILLGRSSSAASRSPHCWCARWTKQIPRSSWRSTKASCRSIRWWWPSSRPDRALHWKYVPRIRWKHSVSLSGLQIR